MKWHIGQVVRRTPFTLFISENGITKEYYLMAEPLGILVDQRIAYKKVGNVIVSLYPVLEGFVTSQHLKELVIEKDSKMLFIYSMIPIPQLVNHYIVFAGSMVDEQTGVLYHLLKHWEKEKSKISKVDY